MTLVTCFCRFLLRLLLVMLCRAVAGVVLSLAEGGGPQAQFVVEAKIRCSGLHGSSFSPLGQVLFSGGESLNLSKLAVIPVLYGGIVANALLSRFRTKQKNAAAVSHFSRTGRAAGCCGKSSAGWMVSAFGNRILMRFSCYV